MQRINCHNCAMIEFTQSDGAKCNHKQTEYLEENIDIYNMFCEGYCYNKCLDCKFDGDCIDNIDANKCLW
ncbi:MAG: hypothetical protein ACRDB0_08065 [Paraclostridium sp.]